MWKDIQGLGHILHARMKGWQRVDWKRKIKINILVCVIILAGFSSVGAISYYTYSKIIKDDIKNISKLTSTNIYSEICNQLTKPIFVGLTMANDSFVKDWLKGEKENVSSLEYQKKIEDYLNSLKVKYNYNSVFLVSENTKNYYHFKGINKVISKNNAHDQWYYDYIKSNLTYELDVDVDEANHNKLSVFINCRIDDDKGQFLGVTGVGLELNKVQDLLMRYRDDFQLEAALFDRNGVVQVHSNSELIQKNNVFDNKTLEDNKAAILSNKDSITIYQYKDKESEGYMIVKYIEDLDWYLLIKKDTSVLVRSFESFLLKDFIIFFAVLALIIIIINNLTKNNDKRLLRMAKTDVLTSLTNRRGFDEALEKIIHNTKDVDNCFVFIFDIDNLKKINDIHGHLAGDDIICHVGNKVQKYLNKNGEVFRWGGDEFSGFVFCKKEELDEILNNIFGAIRNSSDYKKYNASISMGITELLKSDSIDDILKRADSALYQAKDSGKNTYIIR